MDAAGAAVVVDALLEQGTAEWPGVGRFSVVVLELPPRVERKPGEAPLEVHPFPQRGVEFLPAPAAPGEVKARGGTVELPGFGRFVVRGEEPLRFEPATALVARLVRAPTTRVVPRGEPFVAARIHDFVEPAPPRRPWWRRWFG